jgi:DNA invertase Pin-like site-specific DNA recombinase
MHLTGDIKCAAMCARVSTEDQGKGFSIPTQIEACHELAAREGYTVPQAYVLIDEGISRDHNGSAKSAEAPRPGEYPSHYGRHCV